MASKVTKAARPTGIRCFRRSQNVLENDTKCDAKGSQVSNNCSEEQCAIGNDNKS